ncbi:hypothetical protein GGR54DRAFT_650284 [Hypoxylon sp. NC1633]|nr:hypothetical protein GGR54DRAFT_650284 [Hypoxylon sp. NC1633]
MHHLTGLSQLLEHPGLINPQLSSPLFAELPREIRDLIWRFALACYEDEDQLYDVNHRFARPGQAAPLRIDLGLLLTCRAAYVECFLTPFQVNPMVVFDGDEKDIPPHGPLMRSASEPFLCDKLKPWQLANISSVEVALGQCMLEGGSLERVSRLVGTLGRHKGYECRGFNIPGYASFAPPTLTETDGSDPSETQDTAGRRPASLRNLLIGRKITSLSIRMSRTDWWNWKGDPDSTSDKVRLRLEPMINVTFMVNRSTNTHTHSAMSEGYEARKAGNEPNFEMDDFERSGCWGLQVAEYWPDLTRLELVLETFLCKKGQLEDVAKCAKLWTFPLQDGYHLAWDGKEKAITWQGGSSYEYQRFDRPNARYWMRGRNRARDIEGDDSERIKWRPSSGIMDDPGERQEFTIRMLTFERRRTGDRSTGLERGSAM